MENPRILTIIPARGGSKGVPRKNIRLVAGKPLIAWTIEAAKKTGVISKLVVSTEDKEIANVAKEFGADVVERPIDLASDNAPTDPVMAHALEVCEAEGQEFDYVSLIQCTSPLLSAEVIKEAVKKVTTGGFDTCITVFYPDGYEFKWRKKDGDLFVPEHDVENRPRRQDLDLPYHENGAFYITKADLFKKTKNRLGGSDARVTAVVMSEADSLQIDSEHHLWLADQALRSNKEVI